MTDTMTKSSLGRTGSVSVYSFQVTPHHRGEPGQGLKARAGLLLMTCSFSFLCSPGLPAQGLHFPQRVGYPYINHQLGKCPTIYLHVIGWRHSHNQGFSSEITLICVKLTKELTRAVGSFRIPHISLDSLAFRLGLVSCGDSLWSAPTPFPFSVILCLVSAFNALP